MDGNDVIARNTRRFREERQLSIGELARRAGVAKQTVASLEAGVGNPTVDTLERLASALGVTLRAIVTELGVEVLVSPVDEAEWREIDGLELRQLDQAYGSGYVKNSVLRLEAARGPSLRSAGGRGSIRHCYVLSGTMRIGPVGSLVSAHPGDFVRFPAEAAHVFEALSEVAYILVVTTAPQLSMDDTTAVF